MKILIVEHAHVENDNFIPLNIWFYSCDLISKCWKLWNHVWAFVSITIGFYGIWNTNNLFGLMQDERIVEKWSLVWCWWNP